MTANDTVTRDILALLQQKLQEQGDDVSQALSVDTRLVGDLEFASTQLVEFCMAVSKHFGRPFPFQELVFRDGRFQDFGVRDLAAFVQAQMNKPR
ncbi:MAG: acyl carrier protein [Lentisphaerae bacterium]|nr:acyl carrier protein [Lentisphaerota bacterium]